MTLIDRDLPDAAGNVEGQKPRRATLGFVLHEPLMSMLKVERAPPPVFVGAARPTQSEHSSRPTPPVLSGRQSWRKRNSGSACRNWPSRTKPQLPRAAIRMSLTVSTKSAGS